MKKVCRVVFFVGLVGALLNAAIGATIFMLMSFNLITFNGPPQWLIGTQILSGMVIALGGIPMLILEFRKPRD